MVSFSGVIVRGSYGELFLRDVGGLTPPPTIDPARPQGHHVTWTGRASAFHGSRVLHALGPSRNRRRARSRAQRQIGQPKRGQPPPSLRRADKHYREVGCSSWKLL